MNILIIRNNSNAEAIDASMMLATYLESQGIGHTELDSMPLSIESVIDMCDDIDVKSFDMVVSLGGDGTMLRAPVSWASIACLFWVSISVTWASS